MANGLDKLLGPISEPSLGEVKVEKSKHFPYLCCIASIIVFGLLAFGITFLVLNEVTYNIPLDDCSGQDNNSAKVC